jgi:hypothetical protein
VADVHGGRLRGPGGGLGEGPQATSARVLGGLLEVAQGEVADLGGVAPLTCPKGQADADHEVGPLRVVEVDAGEGSLGAEAIALGGEGEGEVGARGLVGGVGLAVGERVGLGAEPGDRLVDALGGEGDLRALAEQEQAERTARRFGQARARLVQLEQGALAAAAAGLREGGQQVEDEPCLGLELVIELLDALADAADGVEAGVVLAAQEVLRGLCEQAAGAAVAALAEALDDRRGGRRRVWGRRGPARRG